MKKPKEPIHIVNLSKEGQDDLYFQKMVEQQILEATRGIKKTEEQKQKDIDVMKKLKDEWQLLVEDPQALNQ